MSDLDRKLCIRPTTPVCERIELLYKLAVAGMLAPSIAAFAERVQRSAQSEALHVVARHGDWFNWILAREALAQVHRLPYVGDPPTQDCYRDVEMTALRGGECKALNVFLVALFMRLGLQAEVVWIMQPGRPLNHVSSIVYLDDLPLWADASIAGAKLGESPYEALQRTGSWYVVGGR